MPLSPRPHLHNEARRLTFAPPSPQPDKDCSLNFTIIISILRDAERPDTLQWLRDIDDVPLHDVRSAIDAALDAHIPTTPKPYPPPQPTKPIEEFNDKH